MRRRQLRKLYNRLCELQKMKLSAKALLIKTGEAKKQVGRVFGSLSLMAYCLQVTLRRRLRDLAYGLTPRAGLN
jgi:hypothetical protein